MNILNNRILITVYKYKKMKQNNYLKIKNKKVG